MTHVLLWLVLAEVLAWAWFVIALPIFSRWPDRGAGISKAAGLLTLHAVTWTLAWTAGLPATAVVGWTIVAAISIIALARAIRRRREIAATLRTCGSECIVVEGLWLLVTLAFLWLRASNPDIAGAEKFTDFAFLNAAIRSPALPLTDPWLAGFPVNYYHFGFVGWAMVARLLRTPPPVAYNLAVALIPGLVVAAAYSTMRMLSERRSLAVGMAVGLVGLGNLAGARQVATLGREFDVWSPSRVIAGTINEFPFFTFFWADLHPHLMAMPNLLVFAALALVLTQSATASPGRTVLSVALLVGVSAGIAVATSPWDAVALGLILLAVLVVHGVEAGLKDSAIQTALVLAGALVVVLPAARTASSVAIAMGLASTHSPLGSFLLVQLLWILPAVVFLAADAARSPRMPSLVGIVVAGGVGAWSSSVTVALLTLLVYLSWASLVRTGHRAMILVAPALTLLLAAELFFIDDSYGPAFERMNIVFKFHLSAILLLALAGGVLLQSAWDRSPSRLGRAAIVAPMAFTALAGLVYPIGTVLTMAGTTGARTLDGWRYLRRDHPGDLAAIEYLSGHVRGTPVVAEAIGDAYSYASRISANTGLPAILGWANHERLWRRDASARAEITRRIESIRNLYEGDRIEADLILRELGVGYVVVGPLERTTYPAGDFAKFEQLGRKVLDADGTALYAIGDAVPAP